MKTTSDLFDRIRVKPDVDAGLRRSGPACEVAGCDQPGTHRAPKGREKEGEYFCFCLDHVRAYNQSYNYFKGMKDTDVESFIRSAATGHRPTWSMGVKNAWSGGERRKAEAGFGTYRFQDGFGLFGDEPAGFEGPARPEARPVRNVERRAFETLHLDSSAGPSEIKARFKELVKRHHPDANGGDKACEDKLREVIEAYNHLRGAGFCE